MHLAVKEIYKESREGDFSHCSMKVMNSADLGKLMCEVLCLQLGVAKLVTTENKAALVEYLYHHLWEPSSKPALELKRQWYTTALTKA